MNISSTFTGTQKLRILLHYANTHFFLNIFHLLLNNSQECLLNVANCLSRTNLFVLFCTNLQLCSSCISLAARILITVTEQHQQTSSAQWEVDSLDGAQALSPVTDYMVERGKNKGSQLSFTCFRKHPGR